VADHREVAADGDHVALAALLQAGQEVGVVAVVGVGDDAGVPHPVGVGSVQQRQGDLGLGLEGDLLGHPGFLETLGVVSPALMQIQPGGDRPGDGPLGGVAGDGDLAVGRLAEGAGVLTGDADGAFALLGEAGVIEDQHAVTLGRQSEETFDPLAVQVLLIPGHGGQQALETLLGGAGDDLGEGVAVRVGVLGEQAGEVAFQGGRPLAAGEVDTEGGEELGEFWQWGTGSVWDSGGLHNPFYESYEPRFI
jgi:hypothetical protein